MSIKIFSFHDSYLTFVTLTIPRYQYKDISEAHELALKEMSQSEQSVKCASEQLITQNWEEITTLTEKLKEANEQRQKYQDQLDSFQQKGGNSYPY